MLLMILLRPVRGRAFTSVSRRVRWTVAVRAALAAERLERALRQFAERALKGPQMAWSLIAEPVDPKVEEERLAYRKAYANRFEKAIREGIEEGCIPDQDARQSSTCLVGAIAESLVGPLSPTQTSQATSTTEDNNDPLINSIICFCMQGLTGTRR